MPSVVPYHSKYQIQFSIYSKKPGRKNNITDRDATETITVLIGNLYIGNRCELVTVPPANWFAFGIISLIK